MKQLLILVTSVFFAIGCKRSSITSNEFVKWVRNNENGLRVTNKGEHFAFHLQYEPNEYKVLKDLSMRVESDSLFKKKVEEVGQYQYYVFTIASLNNLPVLENNISEEQEYLDRQYYLTTLISNDIVLIDGGDTLHPLISHYERNYGQSLSDNINLIFPTSNKPGDKTMIFYDPIFEKEPVELKIEISDIEDIPNLDILNRHKN
jgi:hypothetical protein